MPRCVDPREQALRTIRRFGEAVADATDAALAAYRTDVDAATREAGVLLHLRRAERLCREVIEHAARLPR